MQIPPIPPGKPKGMFKLQLNREMEGVAASRDVSFLPPDQTSPGASWLRGQFSFFSLSRLSSHLVSV